MMNPPRKGAGSHEDHTCMDSVQAICTGSCTRSRRTHAWMDLVTDPIWLTSSRRQLHARSSATRAMHFGSVAVKIIAHHLDVHLCQEPLPAVPVILVKGVLN